LKKAEEATSIAKVKQPVLNPCLIRQNQDVASMVLICCRTDSKCKSMDAIALSKFGACVLLKKIHVFMGVCRMQQLWLRKMLKA
jgi:hypothetical protein